MLFNVASCTARHITFGLLIQITWSLFSQRPSASVSAMNVFVVCSLFWLKVDVSYKGRQQINRLQESQDFWRRYFWAYRGVFFATAGSIHTVCDQGSKRRNEERRKKIKPKKVVWGYMVKWISAYGGCLGGSRRWRTWKSAICLGELINELWSGDLRMGKPTLLAGYR